MAKFSFELARLYPHVQFEGYDTSDRAILFAKGYGYDLPNLSFLLRTSEKRKESMTLLFALKPSEHIPDDEVESFVRTLRERTKKTPCSYGSLRQSSRLGKTFSTLWPGASQETPQGVQDGYTLLLPRQLDHQMDASSTRQPILYR